MSLLRLTQSKCSFIDYLYEQGGHTKSEILELALKKFKEAKREATWGTINARPSHMGMLRKNGQRS